jgi:hypothetical protein
MSHFYRYIRALFFPHFVALSESQFRRMNVKVARVEYDCERIAQSFQNSPLYCCTCEIATTLKVVELYGGRGVRVLRSGRCQRCGKHLNDELRMRDGYVMARNEDGEWILMFREDPMIVSWLKSLFGGQGKEG